VLKGGAARRGAATKTDELSVALLGSLRSDCFAADRRHAGASAQQTTGLMTREEYAKKRQEAESDAAVAEAVEPEVDAATKAAAEESAKRKAKEAKAVKAAKRAKAASMLSFNNADENDDGDDEGEAQACVGG